MTVAFTAGDTWDLGTLIYAERDSSAWTLRLILNSPTGRAVLATESITASGSGFAVVVPASTTASIAAGVYDVVAVLTNATQRITYPRGSLTVLPDLAAASGPVDTRSFAKAMLDLLQAVLQSPDSMGVQEYTIHGRTVKFRDRAEMLRARAQFQQEYRNERIASGEIRRSNYIPVGM